MSDLPRAGVARAAITPPIGAILTGFPDPRRRATHERDPLYATIIKNANIRIEQ